MYVCLRLPAALLLIQLIVKYKKKCVGDYKGDYMSVNGHLEQ